jgi:hypothetical protein
MVSHGTAPDSDQTNTPDPPVAVNVCEKGEPAVAAGNGEVFAMTSAGLTGSVNDPLRMAPASSVTVTVNETGPAAGGIPVKTPAGLRLNQAGRPVADHAKPVPPTALAVNAFEYGEPTVAVGNGEVVVIVIIGGGGGGGPPFGNGRGMGTVRIGPRPAIKDGGPGAAPGS